jgi:hypothetical protein
VLQGTITTEAAVARGLLIVHGMIAGELLYRLIA